MAGSAPRSVRADRPGRGPRVVLESEQQQERDQQREDAERLGDGKAEDQVAELALRGRRIAQRGGEVIAEDGADADAGAAHADARNAGADVFGCHWVHVEAPFLRSGWKDGAVSGPGEWHR